MLSLEDERGITAAIHAYATGIDSRDWTVFRSAFAETIETDYGAFGKWTSGAAITQAMEEMHKAVGPTLHRISNIVIHERGEGAVARSYVDAVLLGLTKDAPVNRARGMYEDVFKRENGRWVIAERRFVPVLMG